jgi:hypothetical protein
LTNQKEGLPMVVMFVNEISNLKRGPSIDASYQVSVHLAKQFQSGRFLAIDQPETRIAYGSHVCKQIEMERAMLIENLP